MRLYHMTSSDACLKILKGKRLKGSMVEDLNDPFELLSVSTGEKTARKLLKFLKSEINNRFCLLSFSDTWQEPLLWAHYGAKHTGVCLGFDVLDSLANKVKYVEERINHSFARETVPFSAEGQRLAKESLYTKHIGWSYEREWRVFTAQEDKDRDGNFYAAFGKDLVLREVILGERSPLKPRQIASLLDRQGPAVTVRAARTAFRTYGIVQHLGVPPRRVGKR